MIYAFGTCTLDTDRYELRRAGQVYPLEPHAFDVLSYLLQHRERVVTKHELLEQLWRDRVVGEGILAQRLMMIRRAIGDSGRSQHCIKTMHGRGYRFAAEVAVHAAERPLGNSAPMTSAAAPSDRADDPSASVLPSRLANPPVASHALAFSETIASPTPRGRLTALFSRPPHFVGRDAELAQLMQWWRTAQQGIRQIGFVSGEPGIGKTALVDAFVAQVVDTRALSIGCGQCVDDYGMGEPYLPLLEALGRLCRDAEGDRFVSSLRQYAPSWLAHLPSVLSAHDRETLVRNTQGVTPTQMLRELTDALEALTAARPLILVLEDLHWSDRATLAWLAYMARKRDSAHVLILGTYRPDELAGRSHQLRSLVTELNGHAQCAELMLEALSAPAIAAYLTERCSTRLPARLTHLIQSRSGGHPLFLVAMADELVHETPCEADGSAGKIPEHDASLSDIIPTNLRQYIEQQFERLSNDDQALLEAASVAGTTFTVAAMTGSDSPTTDKIEARYTTLARRGRFTRVAGIEIWPDGTMTSCYQFKHALYHEVVYARVSAGRRMHLHQQIGARKERGYGDQAQQIAAELADHFARGRDVARAVHYLHYAADNALQRSAYHEAITHLTRGLELLSSLPEAGERVHHELRFLTKLGLALVATKGQAHVDVELAFARASALCHQLADSPQLFVALVGLFSFYVVRSELQAAGNVCEQLLTLAEREPDSTSLLTAHWALGQTLLFQGHVMPARVHLERGIALYQPKHHHALCLPAGFPGDLGVFCRCSAAHALWHLGYPDQALQHIQHALTLSQELAHPFSRALALAYAAMLYQFRRETDLAQEAAETAIVLCQEQGFAYYLAWVTVMKGWALSMQTQGSDGIAHMRAGLDAIRATGARLRQPYYLALLAEACGQTGDVEAGMKLLAEALADADLHGENWREAELHRLRGELLLLATGDAHASVSHLSGCQTIDAQAEQCFQRALAIAVRQQAKSLELRAATSLARLWQRNGNCAEASDLLAPIYRWFAEGLDTADLLDARALLDELEQR